MRYKSKKWIAIITVLLLLGVGCGDRYALAPGYDGGAYVLDTKEGLLWYFNLGGFAYLGSMEGLAKHTEYHGEPLELLKWDYASRKKDDKRRFREMIEKYKKATPEEREAWPEIPESFKRKYHLE